ncbi:MAG: hypothetical protein RSC28_08720 [Bacteroidales bacterium]
MKYPLSGVLLCCIRAVVLQRSKAQWLMMKDTFQLLPYAELSYRPVKSLNITAGWRYPIFYKGNITVEESFGTDLIHYRNSNLVKDFSNMVYLTLTYNFSFGDKRDVPIRKLNNKDTDSGILNRK